ncbi:MAG: class I SAM-dependent methyltransferase [Gemmataceae bacterium]
MRRRKAKNTIHLTDLSTHLGAKIADPLGIIMGPTREVAEFLRQRQTPTDVVYHMDFYNAQKLEEELQASSVDATIFTAADLWDLPNPLKTLIYPVPMRGERELKLDLLEQAYHVLEPHGRLIVISPYARDSFFQPALKKLFGKVNMPVVDGHVLFWCEREKERPRRRHEMTFQVRRPDGDSLRFITRPGTFSYGRFDNGARALVEAMEINPGDKVLDIGCGCGTNGIHAGLRSGEGGRTVFVDSNVRAIELTEMNAEANGLTNFHAVVSSEVTESDVGECDFDVVLANPPYFAQRHIAKLFIQRASELLRPEGRLYLVTKRPNDIGQFIIDYFGDGDWFEHRGYTIMTAVR